jgi:hypothetical protein
VAYSYYNVATTVPLVTLMKDMLIIARNLKVDVFNALELMENEALFPTLEFKPGDGFLQVSPLLLIPSLTIGSFLLPVVPTLVLTPTPNFFSLL